MAGGAEGIDAVVSVHTQVFHVPLAEVLVDAKHGAHTFFELITATVTTSAGHVGVGYTYTGGKGGRSIAAMIHFDLAAVVTGMDAARIEQIWHKMQDHVHYVGRGGVAAFAISAVDIALWDIRCRRAGQPLWKMAGGFSRTTKCYAGGIDLNFPLDKLLRRIDGYLARGHNGVKIKLGQKDLSVDLERVAAVRARVGPDVHFMVDANYGWSAETAIRFAKSASAYDLLWLEEPTICDDYAGYARIKEEGGLALAAGENYHTIYEHALALSSGKVDFLQPDASNIGGVTGWLKVAAIAESANKVVCSHGMQELHVSLMSAVSNGGWMEVHSFPIDDYTTRPLVVDMQSGEAVAPDTPGIGVVFDWPKLAPFQVDWAGLGGKQASKL